MSEALGHADLIAHLTMIKATCNEIYEIADEAGVQRDPIDARDEIGRLLRDVELSAKKLALIAQKARGGAS